MTVPRMLFFLVAAVFVSPAAAESIAIINVNVIPMTSERVLRGQTVLIDGERIEAVGDVDDLRVPEGVRIIDGTDRSACSWLTASRRSAVCSGDPNTSN